MITILFALALMIESYTVQHGDRPSVSLVLSHESIIPRAEAQIIEVLRPALCNIAKQENFSLPVDYEVYELVKGGGEHYWTYLRVSGTLVSCEEEPV